MAINALVSVNSTNIYVNPAATNALVPMAPEHL